MTRFLSQVSLPEHVAVESLERDEVAVTVSRAWSNYADGQQFFVSTPGHRELHVAIDAESERDAAGLLDRIMTRVGGHPLSPVMTA
jgi:hypothetical protein